MDKAILTVGRETFNASTRKSREPTALETESLTLAYTLHAFFETINDLEGFMKQTYEIGLQYAMRRLYILLKMETEVTHLFASRHIAWLQYKVLVEDYTAISIAQNDNVKEEVNKIIALQLKCAEITQGGER